MHARSGPPSRGIANITTLQVQHGRRRGSVLLHRLLRPAAVGDDIAKGGRDSFAYNTGAMTRRPPRSAPPNELAPPRGSLMRPPGLGPLPYLSIQSRAIVGEPYPMVPRRTPPAMVRRYGWKSTKTVPKGIHIRSTWSCSRSTILLVIARCSAWP